VRTKDEILDESRSHITCPKYGDTAHLWLEVRKIEVLIDLRDVIELRACQIIDRIAAISEKD